MLSRTEIGTVRAAQAWVLTPWVTAANQRLWQETMRDLVAIVERTTDGHWEFDEVVYGDEDEAPAIESKRWVGEWSPLSEHESAGIYREGDAAPGATRSTLGALDPLVGTPEPP